MPYVVSKIRRLIVCLLMYSYSTLHPSGLNNIKISPCCRTCAQNLNQIPFAFPFSLPLPPPPLLTRSNSPMISFISPSLGKFTTVKYSTFFCNTRRTIPFFFFLGNRPNSAFFTSASLNTYPRFRAFFCAFLPRFLALGSKFPPVRRPRIVPELAGWLGSLKARGELLLGWRHHESTVGVLARVIGLGATVEVRR